MTYPEQAAQTATDRRDEEPHAPPKVDDLKVDDLKVDDLKVEEGQSVNLTIKVRKRQRLHWLIEAKKQGTSLTAAITEALDGRFGAPK